MSSPSASLPERLVKPDGRVSSVSRRGGVVLRPVQRWTASVHALLRHLEEVGFDAAPRLVGDGRDGHGKEVVTYVEGTFVHPRAWSDEGVWQVGRLLRQLLEATSTFRPTAGAVWRPWWFRSTDPGAVISHADLGPWNIVARDGLPVAFIDWERAGPVDRRDEIAGTAWLNAQLHDDDVAELNGLPDAAARAAQLRRFLDGFELPAAEREGLVTRMIEYAIRYCAGEATQPSTRDGTIGSPITMQSTDPTPLWAMAWRARSAAWMIHHRTLLERTIRT